MNEPVGDKQCVTGRTKFCKPERCALMEAKLQGRRYAREDFLGMCNHAMCPACGPERARRWAKWHRRKGYTIRDRTYELLLPWPDLPVHSDSVESTIEFLTAVPAFRDWLKAHWVSAKRVLGLVGGTEFNAPPGGGDAKYQCHLHLALLMSRRIARRVLRAIAKTWKERGGNRVLFKGHGHLEAYIRRLGESPVKRNGSLRGIIDYISKDPIQDFTEDQRSTLHRRVFNWVERRMKKCAVIRFIDGPALDRHGFPKLAARARYESRSHRNLRDRCIDPDGKYANYLPAVQLVRHVVACPKCRACGPRAIRKNGFTKGGRRRWQCGRCGKSWSKDPEYRPKKRVPGTRLLVEQARRLARWWIDLGSIAATARFFVVSRHTVRIALDHIGRTSRRVSVLREQRRGRRGGKGRTKSIAS